MSEQVKAITRSSLSAEEMEIVKTIRDSGVINFDQLGKVVSQVAPSVFDPNVVADDYVAKAYSSVLQIYKMSQISLGLEEIASLKQMAGELRG